MLWSRCFWCGQKNVLILFIISIGDSQKVWKYVKHIKMNFNIDQTHLQIVIHFSNEMLLIIISLLVTISIYGLKHYIDKIPWKLQKLCVTHVQQMFTIIFSPDMIYYKLQTIPKDSISYWCHMHTLDTHVEHMSFTTDLLMNYDTFLYICIWLPYH